MLPRLYCFLCSLAIVSLAVGLCPARADDADAVKEKLFQAKKTFDAETQKFRQAVGDLLDKREEAARKAGSKKQLDQVKAERTAFEATGDLPAMLPPAVLKTLTAARTNLDKAYQGGVRDYIRLKQDAAADAVEKERQAFLFTSVFISGKRTPLTTLKPFDIKAWNNWFEKDTDKYGMGKDAVPHSLFMHPNFKGEASVSYLLPPKALAFRATVGVPKHKDDQGKPASPLTFEVLGDGKSLWKSEPVAKLDTFQTCTVKVENVKTLTLRVHCPAEHGGAHAVWFAPVLAE